MQTWEEDEFFRAVFDVECILKNVNIEDLAHQLVKNVPVLADRLQTALNFELIDMEIAKRV